MLVLQPDFGGAAWQFYHRHRTPVLSAVLSVAGLVTGVAAAVAVVQGVSVLNTLLLACGVALAALLCILQTRHVPLAVVTTLVPVPGLIWVTSLGGEGSAIPALGYGFGLAASALRAQMAIDQVVDRQTAQSPWRPAAAAIIFAGTIAAAWFWISQVGYAGLQGFFDCALPALSAWMLFPLVAHHLVFEEVFVERANRAREHRIRVFEPVALATQPRWALSLTGIVIIFAVLGWFGAAPGLGRSLLALGLALAGVVLGAGLFMGGWRQGLAAGLVVAAVWLTTLWVSRFGPGELVNPTLLLEITALMLLLAFVGERRTRVWQHRGEDTGTARQRALEEGAGQIFSGLGAAVVLLPQLIEHPGSFSAIIGCVLAVAAGTVLVPAAISALETLAPHRCSVEEIYGQEKKAARF